MDARKRDLVGRKIVAVDFRRFACDSRSCTCSGGHGRSSWHSNPVLTLDNGRRVWFVAEETEGSEYGTAVCITDKGEKK